MAQETQVFRGATVRDELQFTYTDDYGTRFAMLDFVVCEQQSHRWMLLFIPVSFYEQNKSLFAPNRPLQVKGVLDETKPIIYVKDAWLMPQFLAA